MPENQRNNPIVHSSGPEGEQKTAMQIAAEEAIRAKKAAADPNYKGDNPKNDAQIRKDMIKLGAIKPAPKPEGSQLTPEQKDLERSRRGVQIQAKQVGRAEEKDGQWHFGEEFRDKAHTAMTEDLQKAGKLKEGGKIFDWPKEDKPKRGRTAEGKREQEIFPEQKALMKSKIETLVAANEDRFQKFIANKNQNDPEAFAKFKSAYEELFDYKKSLYPDTPNEIVNHDIDTILLREDKKHHGEFRQAQRKAEREAIAQKHLSREDYQKARTELFEAQKQDQLNPTAEASKKITALIQKIKDHYLTRLGEENAKLEAEKIARIEEGKARKALIDAGLIQKPGPKPEPGNGREEDAEETEEDEKERASEEPAVRDVIDTATRYSRLVRQRDPHARRDDEGARFQDRPIFRARNRLKELGMDDDLIAALETIPSKRKRTKVKALLGPFLKEFGKSSAGAAEVIQPPKPAEVAKAKTEADFVDQMKREFAGEIKGEIALLHGSEMQQLQEVAGQMIDFLTEKWRERLTKPIYDMYPEEVKMGMLRAHVSANLRELRGEILKRFIGKIAEQKEN